MTQKEAIVVVFDDRETWSEASGGRLRVVTPAALLLAAGVGEPPPGEDIPLLSAVVRSLRRLPRPRNHPSCPQEGPRLRPPGIAT